MQKPAPVNDDSAGIRTLIGARLRTERERLRLNQTAFAKVAGGSKRTQIAWEKGEATPNAEALSLWATAGADVLYILTGRPNLAPEEAATAVADRAKAFDHTDPARVFAEMGMARQLRQLTDEDLAAVRRIVDRLAGL